MSKIYIVSGGEGGRCRCGHRSKKGELYVLIEGERGDWTLCDGCRKEKKLKGIRVTVEELRKRWFKGVSLSDVLISKKFILGREVCYVS